LITASHAGTGAGIEQLPHPCDAPKILRPSHQAGVTVPFSGFVGHVHRKERSETRPAEPPEFALARLSATFGVAESHEAAESGQGQRQPGSPGAAFLLCLVADTSSEAWVSGVVVVLQVAATRRFPDSRPKPEECACSRLPQQP
jgi:hypothetical protein